MTRLCKRQDAASKANANLESRSQAIQPFLSKAVVLYCYQLLRFHLHFIMPCILKLSEDVGRQKVKGFAILTNGSINDLKIIA